MKETTESSLVKKAWGSVLFLNEKISGSEKKARRNRFRMGLIGLKLLDTLGFTVGSRLVENKWVLENLQKKPMRVLDVGCCCSFLIYELIDRDYDAYATDFNDYEFKERIKFVRSDLTKKMPYQKDFFDAILLISTIEHVGLGQYKDTLRSRGDIVGVNNLKQILKPGGTLLITIPISKNFHLIKDKKRKYDQKAIEEMTRGFTLVKEDYYMLNNTWKKVSKKKAFSRDSPSNLDDAIACLILRK